MNVNEVRSGVATMEKTNINKGNELGKDEFLKILVAQLQSQDPMNPMDDKDFISQMAQFTALEQMTNLNASFSLGQAVNLVGKSVVATVSDSTTGQKELISGKVECVYTNSSTPIIKVGNSYVTLDSIEAIFDENDDLN